LSFFKRWSQACIIGFSSSPIQECIGYQKESSEFRDVDIVKRVYRSVSGGCVNATHLFTKYIASAQSFSALPSEDHDYVADNRGCTLMIENTIKKLEALHGILKRRSTSVVLGPACSHPYPVEAAFYHSQSHQDHRVSPSFALGTQQTLLFVIVIVLLSSVSILRLLHRPSCFIPERPCHHA